MCCSHSERMRIIYMEKSTKSAQQIHHGCQPETLATSTQILMEKSFSGAVTGLMWHSCCE